MSALKRTRVGVIGVGNMGAHHARILASLPGAEFIGAADKRPDRLRALADAHRIQTFADHRDLLPLVEAVTVAVPTTAHHAVVRDCLDRGVHVLVEKPITRELREAEDLISCAETRGLVLQVGHIERFNPAVQELHRLVRAEKVLAISARRCSPPTPHMVDVDVIFDLLIHDLDIALSIARAPVRTLTAMGSAMKQDQIDLVLTHIEFENGVLADLVASKITQQRIRELDVTTERAYLTVDYLTRDISIYREGTVLPDPSLGPVEHTQGVLVAKPVVRPVEPLRAEIEHFLACIGGAAPATSAKDALIALRLADQVAAQVATRRATS